MSSADDAIRATNDDAASCKRFAVQKQYWTDPYINYFVRNSERKAPEINRGYYARVCAVRTLLKKFIKLYERDCQVVNLGAGFDTTYWNLKDEDLNPKNFVEVDFHGVTSKKCHLIKSRKQLLEKISSEDGEISFNSTDLHSTDYHVVAADLRCTANMEQKLAECSIDKNLPTVFVAECVLVYSEFDKSLALVKWISENFPVGFFINYEQVNMKDRFGQVMVDNLRSRNCTLFGIDHCVSLETQRNRFLSTGWDGCEVYEMAVAYRQLPTADVQRIERLEFLDEHELLQQLLQHYCICWAYKQPSAQTGLESINLL